MEAQQTLLGLPDPFTAFRQVIPQRINAIPHIDLSRKHRLRLRHSHHVEFGLATVDNCGRCGIKDGRPHDWSVA